MGAKARVETRATWNDVDLQNGIRVSENRLQAFQGKVERLFRRTPGARAERALGGFFGDLATGNVAGAVEGLAGRIHGLGLGIGIAVGAGVLVFQKFKREIDETDKSAKTLAETLATPRGTIAGAGPAGIESFATSLRTQIADLAQKRDSLGTRFQSLLSQSSSPLLLGGRDQRSSSQSEINSGAKRLGETLADQAVSEENIANVRKTRLTVGEREADLLEIELKKQEALSKIEKDRISLKLQLFSSKVSPDIRNKLLSQADITAQARKSTVTSDADALIASAEQKAAIKGRALAVEQDEANMALGLVNVDKQRIAHLQNQLGLIQDQLRFSTQLTGEERKRLQVDETKAKAAINQERFTKFFQSPSERLNESIQESRRQGAIQQFQRSGGLLNAHRDMSGNIISGIDPLMGKRVGAPTGSGNADKDSAAILKDILEFFRTNIAVA